MDAMSGAKNTVVLSGTKKVGGFLVVVASLVLFSSGQGFSAEHSDHTSSAPKTSVANENGLRDNVRDLISRVGALQAEIDASRKSSKSDLLPAAIAGFAGLAGVFVAGFLTRRSQEKEKVLEFRLRQMELFYAPMFAMLEQSRGLYDKLKYQLVKDDPDRYALIADPKDPKKWILHVRIDKDSELKEFRLLDQLPAVRRYPMSWALVERILSIGQNIAKTISEHAGLAAGSLIDLLGEYLAHYAILSTLYSNKGTEAYPPGWHTIGYFPRKLPVEIEKEYHRISQFIDKYAR